MKPTHYELDLFNLNFESFTYNGTVKISLALKEKTKAISVNCKELSLNEASIYVEATKATIKVSGISYDKKKQIAELSLAEELPGEGEGTLTIKFLGALNQEVGLDQSTY